MKDFNMRTMDSCIIHYARLHALLTQGSRVGR